MLFRSWKTPPAHAAPRWQGRDRERSVRICVCDVRDVWGPAGESTATQQQQEGRYARDRTGQTATRAQRAVCTLLNTSTSPPLAPAFGLRPPLRLTRMQLGEEGGRKEGRRIRGRGERGVVYRLGTADAWCLVRGLVDLDRALCALGAARCSSRLCLRVDETCLDISAIRTPTGSQQKHGRSREWGKGGRRKECGAADRSPGAFMKGHCV